MATYKFENEPETEANDPDKRRHDPDPDRWEFALRSIVSLSLVGSLLVIVLTGMLGGTDPGDVVQYAAPISALAGLAVGYMFGASKPASKEGTRKR